MATMIGDNIGAFLIGPADLSAELAEVNIDVIQRADELAGGAERCVVNDDDTAGRATLLVKQIIEATKSATDRQQTAKKPYQELATTAFDFFKPPLLKLAEAKHKTLAKLDGYRREQARIAAAAEAEARKAAEAVAAAAAKSIDDAIEAEQRALDAAAVAVAARPAEIRSAFGHLAGARKDWKHRVTDIALVPRHLLMINESAVKAHIKARPKDQPPAALPGIEFYEIETTVVR